MSDWKFDWTQSNLTGNLTGRESRFDFSSWRIEQSIITSHLKYPTEGYRCKGSFTDHLQGGLGMH